jgi:hypothetical protein
MPMRASRAGRFHKRTPSFSHRVVPAFGGGFAEHLLGVELAAIHRQRRAGLEGCVGGAPRAFPAHARPRARQRPRPAAARRSWPRRLRCRPPRHSAIACQPAACQVSKGPLRQPKPQRMAKSTSRALSAMSAEVEGTVVEDVAEDGPQELRLRVAAGAQLGELVGRVALIFRMASTSARLRRRSGGSPAWPGRARRWPCRPCGRCRRGSSGPARPWR